MITKEKVKKEIDRLSEVELKKVYLYLSSVTKSSAPKTSIRSLKLKGKLKNKVRPVLRKYGIQKAGVFGSTARGETEANDIDLLVKIDKKISLLDFVGIQQELEDELEMKVDLVEYDSLKPALKEDILKEEVPVYEQT